MDEKVYTGERLTLNFQDIDVRPVLQLLADTSDRPHRLSVAPHPRRERNG